MLSDISTWPLWFRFFFTGVWTSALPHGAGSTRDVTVFTLSVRERFLVWEPGRRFCFTMDEINQPLATQLLEDWVLTATPQGHTRLDYNVFYAPTLLTRLLHPIIRGIFGAIFKSSLKRLGPFLDARAGAA